MGSGIWAFPSLGVPARRLRFGAGLNGDARVVDLVEAEEGRVGDAVEFLYSLPPARNDGGVVQCLEVS